MIPVTTDVIKTAEPGQLETKNANKIMFYNTGQSLLFINSIPIYPLAYFSIEHHINEADQTIYNLRFESSSSLKNELTYIITRYAN